MNETTIRIKLWGDGGKLYKKTHTGARVYYKVDKTGSLEVYQKTKPNPDSYWLNTTLAYYSANAWHSVE